MAIRLESVSYTHLIQYLVKDGEEGRGGKVLLQNEADRKRYEELADMYIDKYVYYH